MLASAGLGRARKALQPQRTQRDTEETLWNYWTLSAADCGSAQYVYRLFSGMVARCVRFFHLVFCVSALAGAIPREGFGGLRGDFLDAGDASGGRVFVWHDGGSFGRRPTLMVDIIAYSVFELASAFAPTLKVFLITRALVWNRDGRRVGRGRGAGVRDAAGRGARIFLRIAAGRICGRISDGGNRLRHAVSDSLAGAECL